MSDDQTSYSALRRLLRGLLPWEVRVRAERRAKETGRTTQEVLNSWAENDYITRQTRRLAETDSDE